MDRTHEGRRRGQRAATAAVGLIALLAIRAAGPAPLAAAASPPDARPRSDTAVASGVYWGTELERLLAAVAAVTEGGFGEAEQKRVRDGALTLAPPSPFSKGRPAAVSFAFDVRVRRQVHRLDVLLRAVDIGYVDVRFETPDSALVAAIRVAIREAHLASLIPLERARVAIEEGRPPAVRIAMTTERKFGCLGFGIEARLERHGDTLTLQVDGVTAPRGVCPAAIGPAQMRRTLDVAPGNYVLAVHYRADTNTFALAVTDSSLSLSTRRATFLTADERLRWRTPPNSFVLHCHPAGDPEGLCADLHRWAARQPGIAPVVRDRSGLPPFTTSSDYDARAYRYAGEDALRRVRECVASIGPRIREAVGVSVQLATWLGERVMVVSERSLHEPHIPLPASVTQHPGCHQSGR